MGDSLCVVAALVVVSTGWGSLIRKLDRGRQLIVSLRDAGANSPARAIPLPRLESREEKALRRLVRTGFVAEAEDGYFLDPAFWLAWRRRERRNVILSLVLSIGLLFVLTAISLLR